MDVVFERGSAEAPKGHALLYFRNSSAPDEIWGSYLVVLPITVDVSKYVPPFLMNQVGELGAKDLSSFAFPPSPERVESHEVLKQMAEARDDDILFGGSVDPGDVPSALMFVNEAIQRYAEIYAQHVAVPEPVGSAEEGSGSDLGVNEVLYGLMSDADRLSELTKLVGRLRYAVEGGEEGMMKEAEADVRLLAKHLPESLQVVRLVEVAKTSGDRGAELANLYLKRCFHLLQQEFTKLGRVEEEIKTLESGDSD